jgi:hypothetical protein
VAVPLSVLAHSYYLLLSVLFCFFFQALLLVLWLYFSIQFPFISYTVNSFFDSASGRYSRCTVFDSRLSDRLGVFSVSSFEFLNSP